METLSGSEIREMFIKYFNEKHKATIVKSSSLVPDNPTVLLTTAGMLQFVPYFLGLEKAPFEPARATSCQKCARAGGKDSDIENVGKTPRHHTFFEMLGNFSFGDYFKKEVIPWAWEFVTEYLKLDKERLYITVYEEDDEAYAIWTQEVGIKKDHIFRKGKKDNFWGPPGVSGPCGPCSEIHYDLGQQYKCSENCSILTCECDRWVEIWNLVFMELFCDENGNLSPLEKKNVDTGMGLERIAMVCQNKASTFETDLLMPILNEVSKLSNVKYKENPNIDISLRIITDHIRCATFMVSDGIIPGNEGRNYVLRMILRRALRHLKHLNVELPALYKLVKVVIDNYKCAYPELENQKETIEKVIRIEEEKFKQTLSRGEKMLANLLESGAKTISGEDAFKLYDTFGFPLELTKEMAKEANVEVDLEGFDHQMQKQKQRAKDSAQKIVLTDDLIYVDIENNFGSTNFIGYDELEAQTDVLEIVKPSLKNIDSKSNVIDIVLQTTPFFGASGGQVGDIGTIENSNFKGKVLTTFKVNNLTIHRCQVLEGSLQAGQSVFAKVDKNYRALTSAHHTLAHLLQAALKKILGDSVSQKGSQVESTRTRFDFSFPRAMTQDEIASVEDLINKWINDSIAVSTEIMDLEEAKKSGAIALFNEKYSDKVRVVSIGNISSELCGGAHTNNTFNLKYAKILHESAIAASVRRIEIVCANTCLDLLKEKASMIDSVSKIFKCKYFEVVQRVEGLILEKERMEENLDNFENKIATEAVLALKDKAVLVPDAKIVIEYIESVNPKFVKDAIDLLARKLYCDHAIVIVSRSDISTRLSIFSMVSDNFIENGITATGLIQELTAKLGGKGGGRPNFAQGSCEYSKQVQGLVNEFREEFLETYKKVYVKN